MHWEVRQHIHILRAGTSGSIVLCISPLTALMMDQQSKFALMGISTEYVAEHSNPDSVKRVLNGQAQLVYISPECTIGNAKFRSMLLSPIYKKNLVAFVVDEAHCVKTWYVQLFMCAVNQNFVIMHRYKHDNKDITRLPMTSSYKNGGEKAVGYARLGRRNSRQSGHQCVETFAAVLTAQRSP